LRRKQRRRTAAVGVSFRRQVPAPASPYVSLIADGPARFLYEKFGFADTAAHHSIGMHRVMGGGPGGGPRAQA